MFYPHFIQINNGKHGASLVQKFLHIVSAVPEATLLSVLVGLHCLRMLLVYLKNIIFLKLHHPQFQLRLGQDDVLRVKSVWPKRLIVRILELIKLP